MSNYCAGCRYDPAKNQRMAMQLKNLTRLDAPKRKAIQQQAKQCRAACRPTKAAV